VRNVSVGIAPDGARFGTVPLLFAELCGQDDEETRSSTIVPMVVCCAMESSLQIATGHRWTMRGPQSKTPTLGSALAIRLVVVLVREFLVAGAGFEPTTWVMSPRRSVRMCIDLRCAQSASGVTSRHKSLMLKRFSAHRFVTSNTDDHRRLLTMSR
jgi:hypothetical protein